MTNKVSFKEFKQETLGVFLPNLLRKAPLPNFRLAYFRGLKVITQCWCACVTPGSGTPQRLAQNLWLARPDSKNTERFTSLLAAQEDVWGAFHTSAVAKLAFHGGFNIAPLREGLKGDRDLSNSVITSAARRVQSTANLEKKKSGRWVIVENASPTIFQKYMPQIKNSQCVSLLNKYTGCRDDDSSYIWYREEKQAKVKK